MVNIFALFIFICMTRNLVLGSVSSSIISPIFDHRIPTSDSRIRKQLYPTSEASSESSTYPSSASSSTCNSLLFDESHRFQGPFLGPANQNQLHYCNPTNPNQLPTKQASLVSKSTSSYHSVIPDESHRTPYPFSEPTRRYQDSNTRKQPIVTKETFADRAQLPDNPSQLRVPKERHANIAAPANPKKLAISEERFPNIASFLKRPHRPYASYPRQKSAGSNGCRHFSTSKLRKQQYVSHPRPDDAHYDPKFPSAPEILHHRVSFSTNPDHFSLPSKKQNAPTVPNFPNSWLNPSVTDPPDMTTHVSDPSTNQFLIPEDQLHLWRPTATKKTIRPLIIDLAGRRSSAFIKPPGDRVESSIESPQTTSRQFSMYG